MLDFSPPSDFAPGTVERLLCESTGDHPFFLSAQRNYQSVGFKETRRFIDENWHTGQIEYEMDL